MLIPISSEKIPNQSDGKHLFDLTPYGNFGIQYGFPTLSVIWTPTLATSEPFPQSAVGSVVQYQKGPLTVHLRGLIRLCATTRLGPQLFAGNMINLGSEPYHRVLYHLKNINLSNRSLSDFLAALSHFPMYQLERDFDNKFWPQIFGEVVTGLEQMANYLDLSKNRLLIDHDHCIYHRPEIFRHVTDLHKSIEDSLTTRTEVTQDYYNDLYHQIVLELT